MKKKALTPYDEIGMLDEELDPLFNVKECLDER